MVKKAQEYKSQPKDISPFGAWCVWPCRRLTAERLGFHGLIIVVNTHRMSLVGFFHLIFLKHHINLTKRAIQMPLLA